MKALNFIHGAGKNAKKNESVSFYKQVKGLLLFLRPEKH
jgi:hypothetical protein